MTAVYVWQSFHYVRQTYGVGCLYGRQQNFTNRDRSLRWWAYHLVFPALIFGRWDMLHEVWGGMTYSLIPVDFADGTMAILWGLAAAGVAVAVAAELKLIVANKQAYRPVGAANYAICFAIHGYGFTMIDHYHRGFFAITIFHAVQYLALVWSTERKTLGELSWIRRVPVFAGFILFWFCLFLLGYGYEQKLTTALNDYWLQASTVLLAGISVHHYTVDSFIWRRSVGA